MTAHFEEFTEREYARLIALARERWRFIGFPEALTESDNVILWRHDIDFSPQRALRLARIEHELGVSATYFVLLNGDFYNPLERSTLAVLKKIRELGHFLALHFDAAAHVGTSAGDSALTRALALDRSILEGYLMVKIETFSYHNPDTVAGGVSEEDEVEGMLNVYSPGIRTRFSYVSDSNGFWRHRRLADVLARGDETKLHVLTHPEWWTPEPMSPRDRVSRCIDGRARRQHSEYDRFLEVQARPNIR